MYYARINEHIGNTERAVAHKEIFLSLFYGKRRFILTYTALKEAA
jgi:hypothetical protein